MVFKLHHTRHSMLNGVFIFLFFNVINLCSFKFKVIRLSSEIFVFANYSYE